MNQLAVKGLGAEEVVEVVSRGQTVENYAGNRTDKPVGMRGATGDINQGFADSPGIQGPPELSTEEGQGVGDGQGSPDVGSSQGDLPFDADGVPGVFPPQPDPGPGDS